MQAEVDRPDRGGRHASPASRATTPQGRSRSRADLVVGADGRALDACASAAGCRSRTSARRSTCSGSACRAGPSDPAETMARFDGGTHPRHAEPRRLLAVRVRHPQGRRSKRCAAQGLEAFRAAIAALAAASPPSRVSEIARLGRRQAAHRAGRTGCAHGTGRGCCASATPRTPCRRSAASASTSPSRTRSPRPTCSGKRRLRLGSTLKTVQRRREFPTRVTQGFQVAVQNNILQRVLRGHRRHRAAARGQGCSRASAGCAASRRAWSGSARGPSTSTRPRVSSGCCLRRS